MSLTFHLPHAIYHLFASENGLSMFLSARDAPEQFVLTLVIIFNLKTPISGSGNLSRKDSFDFDNNMCYSVIQNFS